MLLERLKAAQAEAAALLEFRPRAMREDLSAFQAMK
jgi:hypothetical protein